MSCTQCTFTGDCRYFDEETKAGPNACDELGYCMAEGDDNMDWCEDYDSDWVCFTCGNDNNVEECDCEQPPPKAIDKNI